MRIKIKSKRGQAMILTLVFMTVILGMAAAVVDVGAWYRTHRQMQNNADAAALAGATALPESTGQASSLAVTYANRNGGGVTGSDITFSSREVANDQIQVTARKAVPGVFAKLFGLDSVTVRAHATALAAPPAQPKWAAPFAVDVMHPMLQCEPLPCFNQNTELDLDKVGPGAFHIINIDGSHGGTSSSDTRRLGRDRASTPYMPLGWYYSDPGSKFNSGNVRDGAGRPDRHRPAVPGLPPRARPGRRFRLRGHRLGRLPPDRLLDRRQGEALRLVHPDHLGRHPERELDAATTSAFDRSPSSTKEISPPDRNDSHQEMEHAEMRKNNERGQSMVITVVFMVVLLGFAALVVDVGSWYRAHRSTQATADASALAGAAVLPDTAAASALANQYATKNGGSGSGWQRFAADHDHAVGLRDGHDQSQGHTPLARLLRQRLRLGSS